jgi:hypothetical protein
VREGQEAVTKTKYIVLHATTFGAQGEREGHQGLWAAVDEFLAGGAFRLRQPWENNNGLTVLERVSGSWSVKFGLMGQVGRLS